MIICAFTIAVHTRISLISFTRGGIWYQVTRVCVNHQYHLAAANPSRLELILFVTQNHYFLTIAEDGVPSQILTICLLEVIRI